MHFNDALSSGDVQERSHSFCGGTGGCISPQRCDPLTGLLFECNGLRGVALWRPSSPQRPATRLEFTLRSSRRGLAVSTSTTSPGCRWVLRCWHTTLQANRCHIRNMACRGCGPGIAFTSSASARRFYKTPVVTEPLVLLSPAWSLKCAI